MVVVIGGIILLIHNFYKKSSRGRRPGEEGLAMEKSRPETSFNQLLDEVGDFFEEVIEEDFFDDNDEDGFFYENDESVMDFFTSDGDEDNDGFFNNDNDI